MALLLRRQYDLTTLVIGFELAGRQPMVRCTLERDRWRAGAAPRLHA
ncbi:MAG: hypothetical protein IPM07_26250 [Anaerolineales bacterium]|nr:hypothetical protein [Anaerolineales bacterium]